MKAIIITLLSILLVTVLIVGNIHWKETSPSSNSSNVTANLVNSIDLNYYLSFAAEWPENAQKQLRTKIKNKDTYRILLLGSNSIGYSNVSLLSNIKESLTNTYDKYVSVESIVYNGTTTDYLSSDETKVLIEETPDMVIFEPFLLTDNNVIDITTSLANLSSILKETKEKLPNVTFILQPANPIYYANLYPIQVAALKEYAASEHITYLDHWQNWPDGNSNEILDYLNQDGTPNKKGYEIWSNYITDYLVRK